MDSALEQGPFEARHTTADRFRLQTFGEKQDNVLFGSWSGSSISASRAFVILGARAAAIFQE